MSGRKRKASDDLGDDRMSTSPTASPSITPLSLANARAIKRIRTSTAVGRPLDLPRLLETLKADQMRGLLQQICDENPAIGREIVSRAPRPSVESTLQVLSRYEDDFKAAFPFGTRPTSDYTFNRVKAPMHALIEALKDFTPHFLPPNETQPGVSLVYLDAVTNIVHRLPNWDTYANHQTKHEAYEELAQAWAIVVREAAKRGGGYQLQFGGWDQKLIKHNELSGSRLQGAVNELRQSVGWAAGGAGTGSAAGAGAGPESLASGADERAAIRQQLFAGTYGSDLSVGGSTYGRW